MKINKINKQNQLSAQKNILNKAFLLFENEAKYFQSKQKRKDFTSIRSALQMLCFKDVLQIPFVVHSLISCYEQGWALPGRRTWCQALTLGLPQGWPVFDPSLTVCQRVHYWEAGMRNRVITGPQALWYGIWALKQNLNSWVKHPLSSSNINKHKYL